jgi:hypothetical protein
MADLQRLAGNLDDHSHDAADLHGLTDHALGVILADHQIADGDGPGGVFLRG